MGSSASQSENSPAVGTTTACATEETIDYTPIHLLNANLQNYLQSNKNKKVENLEFAVLLSTGSLNPIHKVWFRIYFTTNNLKKKM